jgi:hypothetical protein
MAAPLLVTSAANSGPGNAARRTRDRVASPVNRQTIVVATAADIDHRHAQLNYWGTEPIEIIGSGQTISIREDIDYS